MGGILIGTCSWTDPTLIESGRFYPPSVRTAEERLRYYAGEFRIVEVDSTYYALPSERTSRLWVERTPDDFVFNVKAFRLLTQHPASPSALPADLRQELPAPVREKATLYLRDLPRKVVEELWGRFRSAILPLDSAGKLGVVLLQFPPWFAAGASQMEYILSCKERLGQYRAAIEFRHVSWLGEANRGRVLGFLRENDLPLVCVDEPQGFKSSVPPLAEATSDIAVVRFHGRNRAAWEKPGVTASERFNYYYSEAELEEWVPRIRALAEKSGWVHVLFNTNYGDQGVVNARLLGKLLGLAHREPPSLRPRTMPLPDFDA